MMRFRKFFLVGLFFACACYGKAQTISIGVKASSFCAPATVQFARQGQSAGITSVNWDLGNGSHFTGDSVQGYYASAGKYTVVLTVVYNGTTTRVDSTTIMVYNVPTYTITTNRGSVPAGDTVVLCEAPANLAITGSDPTIQYHFLFGDGREDYNNPAATIYNAAGIYTLIVSGQHFGGNCTSYDTTIVMVYDKVPAKNIITDTIMCNPNDSVKFSDATVYHPSLFRDFGKGKVEWIFDNGTVSIGSSANHLYGSFGKYAVKQVVTTPYGCVLDTVVQSIRIFPLTTAATVLNPTPWQGPPAGCVPFDVTMGNIPESLVTSSPITNYIWRWDYGVNATDTSNTGMTSYANHTYLDTGVFHVYLTIINQQGCRYDSYVSTVRVGTPPPAYDFNYTFVQDCKNTFSVQVSAYYDTLAQMNPYGAAAANEWTWWDPKNPMAPIATGQSASLSFYANFGYQDAYLIPMHNGCAGDMVLKHNVGYLCPPIVAFKNPQDNPDGTKPIFCTYPCFGIAIQNIGAMMYEIYMGDAENNLTISPDYKEVYGTPPANFNGQTKLGPMYDLYTWNTGQDSIHDTIPAFCYTPPDSLRRDPNFYLYKNGGVVLLTMKAYNWDSTSVEYTDTNGYHKHPTYNRCKYCEQTVTQVIVISDAIMNFVADKYDICQGESVHFIDSTLCSVPLVSWTFTPISAMVNPAEYPVGKPMRDMYDFSVRPEQGQWVTFNQPNNYKFMLLNTDIFECQRYDTIEVNVKTTNPTITYYSATFCQLGSPYSDANFTNLTHTGYYYDTLQSVSGCGDSIVCLILNSRSITYYYAYFCQNGSPYSDANFTNLAQPGTYFDTLKTASGCDSIVCLHLYEVPIYSYYASLTCQGGVYSYSDGNFSNLTQPGTYFDTLRTAGGCDSIVCLVLRRDIVISYYAAYFYRDSVYSDAHFSNLTLPGTYYDTLKTADGCDSIVCLYLYWYSTSGSGGTCANLNFGYGNFNYWQCYAGSCSNGNYQVQSTLPIPGRHTIMNMQQLQSSGQLYDEHCNKIKKVPDGYSFSAKIGNASAGAEVDGLEYTMKVDSMNSLLVLSFAWVMEQPMHQQSEQPQFNMQIRDTAGKIISSLPCSNINFISGFNNFPVTCDGSVQARNWITTGFSLESLIGQTIKIYFETMDCALGCHFGYAYVVGECRPMRIDMAYCAGMPSVRLTAPEGFQSYEWSRSSMPTWHMYDRMIVVQNPLDGEIFTVTVQNELGCQAQLKTKIEKTSVVPEFFFGVKDANGHVPLQENNWVSWYDTCSRTATFVDRSRVINGKLDYIRWEIQGLNIYGKDSIFTYTFPEPSVPTTYLVRQTAFAENGCADTSRPLNHYITIYPQSSKCPKYYSATICQGGTYTDTNFKNLTQTGTYYDTLRGSSGEDSLIFCLSLFVDAGTITHYSAMLCQGSTYSDANFKNITKAGTYYDTLENANGCDSIVCLTLKDFNALIAGTVMLYDSTLLSAGTVELHKMNKNGKSYSLFTSALVDSNGMYSFTNIEAGNYLIKAKPQNSKDGLQTYYKSADQWKNATPIIACQDSVILNINIVLAPHPSSQKGNSFISGYVGQDSSGQKSLSQKSVSNPAEGVNVYLQQEQSSDWKTIAQTLTDADGYFAFKDIPAGRYKVILDVPGLTLSNPEIIDIGDGDTVIGIEYEITKDSIVNKSGGEVGIVGAKNVSSLRVYPNPAGNQLTIACRDAARHVPTVEIYSVVGQMVGAYPCGRPETTIDISHLASGMYYLKIGNKTVRFVKE